MSCRENKMCHHIEFKEQREDGARRLRNGQKRNKTLGAMKFVKKITMLENYYHYNNLRAVM